MRCSGLAGAGEGGGEGEGYDLISLGVADVGSWRVS